MEESEGLHHTLLANLHLKLLAAYMIPHWTAMKNSAIGLMMVKSAALSH